MAQNSAKPESLTKDHAVTMAEALPAAHFPLLASNTIVQTLNRQFQIHDLH